MPDRDAFIATVAAAPSDDLPRLVFADWLDENGEPERAEFIRTQIRWFHADTAEKQHLNARAAELFRDHWQRWLRPFLLALEPDAHLPRWYAADTAIAGQVAVILRRFIESSVAPAFTFLHISRGFASTCGFPVDQSSGRGDLGSAFTHEPVVSLNLLNPLHTPHWNRFTHPALRRVERVTATQRWEWQVPAPESTAFLEDPHLAGVRQFDLDTSRTDQVQDGPRQPFPIAWLERFVRSALAYRLTDLALDAITADGVRPLCRPGKLHLERLSLAGNLDANSVRHLGQSGLADTVQKLELTSAELGNNGAAALARDEWRKLNHLTLNNCGVTSAVLPALAAAAFTPRLKVLDLSDNPLIIDPSADLAGLHTLSDALDPGTLERLDLSATGLTAVPHFLAERFGHRVTV